MCGSKREVVVGAKRVLHGLKDVWLGHQFGEIFCRKLGQLVVKIEVGEKG
ncbi:MAG: hypothetical protein ACREFP_05590 [Acetobacteraceae bacterium]